MRTPPTNSSKNNKIPTPFSLRLTFEERAALEQEAGDEPLGAYIRKKLLGSKRSPEDGAAVPESLSRMKKPWVNCWVSRKHNVL